MSSANQRKVRTYWLALCWLLVSVAIVMLSVHGRSLQYWVADTVGYTLVAWFIAATLVAAIGAYLHRLGTASVSMPWRHLVWFLPLFLVLPLFLERVEERLHFVTFGAFGVLSILLFPPRIALVMCVMGSAGDELLQHYLPDRVGDWRDVAMNCLASLSAAYFVWQTSSATTRADTHG